MCSLHVWSSPLEKPLVVRMGQKRRSFDTYFDTTDSAQSASICGAFPPAVRRRRYYAIDGGLAVCDGCVLAVPAGPGVKFVPQRVVDLLEGSAYPLNLLAGQPHTAFGSLGHGP